MKNKRIHVIDVLLVLLWFLLIYGSTDGAGYSDNPTPLWRFLYSGFIIQNGFRLVEISIILLSCYLLFFHKDKYEIKSEYRSFFNIVLILFLLILLNPNNNATIFECFFANDSKFIILFSLFYASMMFLKENVFFSLLIKLMKIGFWVILYKCVSNLIFYFFGIAQVFKDGVQATIPQSDVLYFVGLSVSLLFYFYLITNDTKKLVLAGVLFFIMMFSMRRTEIIEFVLVILLLIIFNQIKFPEKGLNLKRIFQYSLIPIIFVIALSVTSTKFSALLSRYISVFTYFDESLDDENMKDSGHIEQSIKVTQSMIKDIKFWGSGLQNEPFYLEGQSAARAHSNLAHAMAKQGIFVSFFFIYCFFLFVRKLIKTIKLDKRKHNRQFILFRFLIYSILVMFFISGWASGNVMFDNYPQTYISFILIFSLTKLNQDNVKKITQVFQ